jgi:2-iminobutanoate/2-iminopropanoate deaminase
MARRQSVHIQKFKHANPIPNACRIGNLMMSGVIVGMGDDGKIPPDLSEQCALMFAHVRSTVEAAGGSTEDIIKLTVWMKDPSQRDILNKEWLAMFPDPTNRPARHTMPSASETGPLIQCDVTAVIG